jgi:hydroxyacylglutathione hydrolase
MNVIKEIEIIPGVGKGSNVYVIDNELIVDSGTGEFFTEAKEQIIRSCNTSRIRKIIATHSHHDHSGGLKKFRDWLKVEIYAHPADSKSLERGIGTYAELFSAKPRIVTVDNKLHGGSKIKTENFTFTVLHTPGHTLGSICLYEPERKILISGDTLLDNGAGGTAHGGDSNDLKASIKALSEIHINYLLPGHGRPKISGVNFHIKQILAQHKF